MVNTKTKMYFRCEICEAKYEYLEEALRCCYDEKVEDLEFETYECEMCSKEFKDEIDASNCEEMHKDRNDLKFQDWEHKNNFDKLIEQGNKPNQLKLQTFI